MEDIKRRIGDIERVLDKQKDILDKSMTILYNQWIVLKEIRDNLERNKNDKLETDNGKDKYD
jgi:hypothetical protein